MKKILRLVILLQLLSWGVSAQILDDSTRLVYGPTTTRFKTVLDLKHSDTLYHTVDTSLYNLEQFQGRKRQDQPYYDLGVNGTAMQPMYFRLPDQIGKTSGFTAYDPYAKTVEEFKYYDTKSPFISLYSVFGGKQRNQVEFSFSRNINPQWNVGFDIKRISSNRQIGSGGLREKQLENSEFDIYTFHRSSGGKYQMMFHAYQFEHKLFRESGGINEADPKDYFSYRNANIWLSNTANEDFRRRLYLYHQYSIQPFLEIYNSVKSTRFRNRFMSDLATDGDYYNRSRIPVFIRTDDTSDKSRLNELEIEAGVKGRVVNHIYYTAYAKRRSLNQKNEYLGELANDHENYIGGDLVLHVNDKNELGGAVEVMDKGQYQLKAFLDNNYVDVSYRSMSYRPSYLVDRYFGNHYDWSNGFDATFANAIQGSAQYDLGFLFLKPEVEISTVKDYIYFDTFRLPAQNNGTILINNYRLTANFTIWNHVHFDNMLVFNNIAGDNHEVMQIADWNLFGKWYYENIVFKGDMEMQVGFNVRWQSAYTGLAYDPIVQQFHNQYGLETSSYFVSDIFFVMKKDDLSIFLKMNYVNQQRDNGYFEVPYYPGLRREFDIGVRWMFFD